MARKTPTPAEMVEQALQAADLGAAVIENHLAIRVVNPDNGHGITLWMPDEDGRVGYLWGPSFQFDAPAQLPPAKIAEMVKATARHW